jgi:type I restriction enzyme S subunit
VKYASGDWPIVRLGDIIDLFDSQRVPLNSRERQERRGQYPYYGAQGVIDHIDGYIFDGSYILVAEDGENLNSKKLPLALFADGKFWVNNHAHILKAKPNVADDSFLLACLNNADIRPFVTGAAQPKLSQANLRQIEIPLPPLSIQKRIAQILSAYDELIENSQRRIRVLETMAKSLYREWFVNFRFPGHEKVPLVPSALGEIPEGWPVGQLSDVAQLKSGFAFKSETFVTDGEHQLVTIRNVQDGVFNPEADSRVVDLPAKLPSYCMLKDSDILLSLTGNVGRVCLVYGGAFLLNQRVAKILPVVQRDWAMTYCTFRDDAMRTKLEQLSNGVAQQNLSPVLASKIQIVLPPASLRERFQVVTEPMLTAVVQHYTKMQNLRRVRDLLLPRLLSGQLNVGAP